MQNIYIRLNQRVPVKKALVDNRVTVGSHHASQISVFPGLVGRKSNQVSFPITKERLPSLTKPSEMDDGLGFEEGRDANHRSRLKQTPLPDKYVFTSPWGILKEFELMEHRIRCSLCKRMKAVTIYSNKQILELRHHLYLGYDVEHSPIKCRKCVQTQNQELTCAICGEVKALDGFSKAQRRTPDTAVSVLPSITDDTMWAAF